MTHLLNADALIIVLDFFRFLLRIVGSLLSCRCLIFKVRLSLLRPLQAHPFSKVPDYITTSFSVCQHFFSFFLKLFYPLLPLPLFRTIYWGLTYILYTIALSITPLKLWFIFSCIYLYSFNLSLPQPIKIPQVRRPAITVICFCGQHFCS